MVGVVVVLEVVVVVVMEGVVEVVIVEVVEITGAVATADTEEEEAVTVVQVEAVTVDTVEPLVATVAAIIVMLVVTVEQPQVMQDMEATAAILHLLLTITRPMLQLMERILTLTMRQVTLVTQAAMLAAVAMDSITSPSVDRRFLCISSGVPMVFRYCNLSAYSPNLFSALTLLVATGKASVL